MVKSHTAQYRREQTFNYPFRAFHASRIAASRSGVSTNLGLASGATSAGIAACKSRGAKCRAECRCANHGATAFEKVPSHVRMVPSRNRVLRDVRLTFDRCALALVAELLNISTVAAGVWGAH